MELFTLGEHTGAYTERDIEQVGRSPAGVDREDLTFRFRPAFMTIPKTLLGRIGQFRRGTLSWGIHCWSNRSARLCG
jgi:hypothetical protein